MNWLSADVVIPTRGRPTMLAEAIGRILAQGSWQGRVIVVNDGTQEVCQDLPSHPAIEVAPNQRQPGAPGARNTGLGLARAPWIVFHDDDDLWDEGFIETMASRANAVGREVVALFSGFRLVFPGGGSRCIMPPTSRPDLARVLVSNVVGPPSFVLCRTEAVREVGGFDETLPGAQDWDLWIRLAGRGALEPVGSVLGTYRVHHYDQISTSQPGDRFRRYLPFFDKRLAHPGAGAHRRAFADEVYWWGVLAAWTGDLAAATEAFDWALRCYPDHLKARIMRAVALSPLRRTVLRLIYRTRRSRMRIEDRGEALDLG